MPTQHCQIIMSFLKPSWKIHFYLVCWFSSVCIYSVSVLFKRSSGTWTQLVSPCSLPFCFSEHTGIHLLTSSQHANTIGDRALKCKQEFLVEFCFMENKKNTHTYKKTPSKLGWNIRTLWRHTQRGGSKHEVQMAFTETTIYMVTSHHPTSFGSVSG